MAAYTDKPIFFWKASEPYGYFCQWYLVDMKEDSKDSDEYGAVYNCTEQFMMYHKAKTFNDAGSMAAIMAEKSPVKQKALGRAVKGFNPSTWDEVKFDVVVRGNRLKFGQGKARADDRFVYASKGGTDRKEDVSLKELLLATGERELAEASRFDNVWGIGWTKENALDAKRRGKWGQNLLGKAIMQVRTEMQST